MSPADGISHSDAISGADILAHRPRTAIATVCLSGTLADKLDAAAHAGFDGVEIFENDLIASAWPPERISRVCAELGLSIDLYQPLRDFDAADPEIFAANLRRAEHKLDLMEGLGADTLLVCSSTSSEALNDEDRIAGQLHTLAGKAAERGIKVAYEALAWGRFVHTAVHSWHIVQRAQHPALGLCLDSFHVLSHQNDTDGIRAIDGSRVFFLQLADAPPLAMDVMQWSRHHRLFPGQGEFDLRGFLADVLATGYQGPLSLEVFNDVFRQADPRAAAIDGMRSLLALQERVPDERTTALPRAPRLSGHAFTEVVVDETSQSEIRDTLTRLGFRHIGTHRSKPVQLWTQSRVRVLLTSSRDHDGTAAVSGLGVNSSDPARAAQRARALLAPELSRARQPDEAELPVVTAPDGTALFFCNEDDQWLNDFAGIARTSTGARASTGTQESTDGLGIGIEDTDHLALTQPFDRFDEASLFYRSVLGLEPETAAEFAAPFGLVRSQGVAAPDRTLRVALSVALLRRGDWAPGVRAPQHIAFTTGDIFSSARAARANGAPILPIPDNYYDDLDARLDLPRDFLTAMRECDVLYDRAGDGEFLHFYTDVLGDRVFFEVVQRIDGYAGFGVANAAIRMAAHRAQRLARERGRRNDPSGC